MISSLLLFIIVMQGQEKSLTEREKHKNRKQEVTSLLESAGFSRSNPYYIVQQGKVSALATMKDKDRLELLKEVAGTRVYEEKKRESLKIIAEADTRKEKVEEVISYVDQRLSELNEEKEELSHFQDLDKRRRCLEYAIYEKQRKEALLKLAEVSFLSFSFPSSFSLIRKGFD